MNQGILYSDSKSAQSGHMCKGLKVNEGEDWRNHQKLVSSPEILRQDFTNIME